MRFRSSVARDLSVAVITGIVFYGLIALVVAAQGAVIFATALLALHLLKTRHPAAKILAMALSWFVWVMITCTGYFATGGDGSFMKGFAIVLLLCVTAAGASLAYLAGWILWPLIQRKGLPDVV